jgi:hypothetical protein
MSITHETKRSGFYNELTPEKQKEYLGLKREKFLPTIDNLYFSIFLEGDKKEFESSNGLTDLLTALEAKKQEAIKKHESVDFAHGLSMTLKAYTYYSLCLTEQDLYDIFICKAIPNEKTPRIVVQLRAFGLWTHGVETILNDAYKRIDGVLRDYCGNTFTITKCRENRIDYCYHTNAIGNVSKLIEKDPRTRRVKNLETNLSSYVIHGETESVDGGTVHNDDYLCYGRVKSNNVRARIYDKVKEVIEMGYKDFFFKIWYDNGLISYYDKWCMEYAFPYRNTDYLYKAAVAFYVGHCAEYRKGFKSEKDIPLYFTRCCMALESETVTLADFKRLAREYMPKVTTVLNIEYETKRKFYYYSEKFIGNFKTLDRDIPKPLERIYQILDNKSIFLDYLTSKTLSFHSGKDEKDEPKYLNWWNRLRNTKLGGIKADEKLLREYSFEMDKRCVQRRAINAVASSAVYDDNIESGFVEDFSDFLADLTDNRTHTMCKIALVNTYNGYLVEEEDVAKGLLKDYQLTKAKKNKQLKNRKKRRGDNRDDKKVT